MPVTELLQSYRLLDVAYGNLEISERIRNELALLRFDQVKAKRKSAVDRLLVMLIAVSGGVPVLYGLLPNDLPLTKQVWIAVFTVVAIAYGIIGLLTWWQDRNEATEIESLLDSGPPQTAEDEPVFLLTQISTFSTRKSLADEILASEPPEHLKVQFESLSSYWQKRIDSVVRHAAVLHRNRRLSQSAYEKILQWAGKDSAGPGAS